MRKKWMSKRAIIMRKTIMTIAVIAIIAVVAIMKAIAIIIIIEILHSCPCVSMQYM